MKKRRVYDCSNSPDRPTHHLDSMGPKENDIMRGLKQHCSVFNYEFIDNPYHADIVITNDVYPKEVLALDRPRVKRMDGVYWNNSLKERNEPLNQAAMESDWVIFISEYSRYSFSKLYNKVPKACSVILNSVDNSVFFKMPMSLRSRWVASASNWARPEKRFNDLMLFAEKILPNKRADELILIGRCDADVPSNVWKTGYIDDEMELNRCLNMGDKFVNFSYRDPAPKTVCQAINCGLPVLYADSGGVGELVDAGVYIPDEERGDFEDETPRLSEEEMRVSYDEFMDSFSDLRFDAERIRMGYMTMLYSYFSVMTLAIKDYYE